MHKKITNQQGLTLIELVVAFGIGIFIAAAVAQVFNSNKNTSLINLELAKIQENGRFAMDVITRDLRLTDNWGCAGAENITSHIDGFDFGEPLVIDNQTSPNPDSLQVRGAMQINKTVAVVLQEFDSTEAIPLSVLNNQKLTSFATDPLMIGDCQSSDIFSAAVNANTLEHGVNLSKRYDETAFLYRPFTLSYSVNEQKQLIREFNGIATAIAEGVSDMQIQYGVDTDPNDDAFQANVYKTSLNEIELNNVASIRVNLLFESLREVVTGEPQTFNFNWEEKIVAGRQQDIQQTSTDKRLRKAYTSIVAIRNRLQ